MMDLYFIKPEKKEYDNILEAIEESHKITPHICVMVERKNVDELITILSHLGEGIINTPEDKIDTTTLTVLNLFDAYTESTFRSSRISVLAEKVMSRTHRSIFICEMTDDLSKVDYYRNPDVMGDYNVTEHMSVAIRTKINILYTQDKVVSYSTTK